MIRIYYLGGFRNRVSFRDITIICRIKTSFPGFLVLRDTPETGQKPSLFSGYHSASTGYKQETRLLDPRRSPKKPGFCGENHSYLWDARKKPGFLVLEAIAIRK